MATEQSPHRRRGVIASRVKLTHALAEAGLRTQAALAERIADREGLDSPPKDAVSRAFRELAVDLQTLERIASALGVDVYSLYRTSDEPSLPVTNTGDRKTSRTPLAVGIAAALVVIVATAGLLLFDERSTAVLPDVSEASPPAALDLGASTLVVLPVAGDAALTSRLRERLAETFSVATHAATVAARSHDPASVADTLRADAVVEGEIVTVGRFAGVRVYLFANGVRRQIWGESLPLVALDTHRDALAARAAIAVRRATGFPVPDGTLPGHFPLARVQDDYLEGAFHLDQPSNELNVKRAQTRFEAALRRDSNYARAHAGLCEALLEEHWMSDEQRALKDAGLACGQALQLAPDDPVVAAAHAHYLRLTGRIDEAVAMYERVVADFPLDASAWTGLAASRLHAYRQSGEPGELAAAKVAAKKAADVDPRIWKPLFSLATMEYFDADVGAAIAASERALERDRNEYVAANLGTFYLCDGSFAQAIEAYELARELAPGNYVGDEFLGMAYYFMGEFETSAALRRRAIESISTGEPEIHEMWGNLGDSYRQLGDNVRAIDAYLRAAEIAERDHLRGTAPAADRAARAYYYTILGNLDAALVPPSVERRIAAELDDIDASLVSATANRRMAQIWLLRGDLDKASRSLSRATATCRGYGSLPDLELLVRTANE